MDIWKRALNILPYIFVFLASLYRPWDADLGWHLKYGEYFFKTGQILKSNTFSSEMPDFIWPNAAWLTDIISYATFNLGGFFGLSLLAAFVITLTFHFFSKAFDLTIWEKAIIFPLLVFFESPVNQVSFRGQLLSIMFLGAMMWLLSLYEKGRRRKFLGIIPLFTIWANTHGQFILGLGIYAMWNFFYLLRNFLIDSEVSFKTFFPGFMKFLLKNLKEVKFLGLVFLASVLATLIHPYGFGIYTDAFLHFGNKDLHSIMEYLPFDDLTQPWWNQMILSIILFFGIIILFFTDQLKKQIHHIAITSILYILSWDVRRYAWSLYYLTIPLLKPFANFIKPDSERNTVRAALVLFILYIGFAVMIKYPFTDLTQMNWDTFCKQAIGCSEGAIDYVRDHKLDKNLYSMYNWGGYIIWKHPEIKPSIDGRMHLWRDEKGYSAFSNYYTYEQNFEDIDYSKYDVVLMSREKPVYDRLNELVEEGRWEKKYEDEFGGVFTRKKISN